MMPVTLADVAHETGLAIGTVADVLRGRPGYAEATRRRVLAAAQRLKFVPNHLARSLQSRKSMTIGVVARLVDSTLSGPMLRAVTEHLGKEGYTTLFADGSGPGETEVRALRELLARRVDGVIVHSTLADEVLDQWVPADMPCVAIRSAPAGKRPCVVTDRVQSYRQAVQWLASVGHRRIAFLGPIDSEAPRQRYNTLQLKIEGYRAGMEACGLKSKGLMIETDVTPGSVAAVVRAQLPLFRSLTAVLASNDRVAIELIHALRMVGLEVPEHCSVIGFDGTEFALAVSPTLSTFRPRWTEAGVAAAQMLLTQVQGRTAQSTIIVPELVVRESVRAIAPVA